MKSLIVLIGSMVMFVFVACNKTQNTETPVPVSKTEVDVPVENKDLTKWTSVSFYSSETASTWTVRFSAYFNENHPNGYVIIKDFSTGNLLYVIRTANDPAAYIDTVHGNLAVDANSAFVLQTDETALGYFRTAEAAAVAYYNTEKTQLDEKTVAFYGRSMKGNRYGVPAKFKLRQ